MAHTTDIERRFHEEWLGMVQPEGLVVSIPALLDAQCMQRNPPAVPHRLRELAPDGKLAHIPSSSLATRSITAPRSCGRSGRQCATAACKPSSTSTSRASSKRTGPSVKIEVGVCIEDPSLAARLVHQWRQAVHQPQFLRCR
jgi:hypothetical protein